MGSRKMRQSDSASENGASKDEFASDANRFAQMRRAGGGLRFSRHCNRRAHFERDGGGHFVDARIINIGEFFEQIRARRRRRFAPTGKRRARRGDGAIDIAFRAQRNHRARRFVGRIDDLAIARERGRDPAAVDIKRAFFEHAVPPPFGCAKIDYAIISAARRLPISRRYCAPARKESR